MRALFLLFVLGLLAGRSIAQSDSACVAVARDFADDYARADFKGMHDHFGGLLRTIYQPGILKKSFGTLYDVLGAPHLDSLVRRGHGAYRLWLSYAGDPTEPSRLDLVFNKHARIVGMGSSGVKQNFPKDSVARPMPSEAGLKEKLDPYLADKHARASFDGCAMVIDSGRVRYMHCLGLADRRTGEPLTDTTLFELASCSKPFTAQAILLLVEQGRVELDAPVQRYLPELPYKKVTLRQLLSHTGGLPDYMALLDAHWTKDRIATNADVLAALVKYHPKPLFGPGKKEDYSNTGFVLLACVIERVTGQTYAQALDRLIFRPAGMPRARVYNTRRSGEVIPGYAYGTVPDSARGRALPDSVPDSSYVRWLDGVTGDGTVNASLRDLAQWDAALRAGKLLSPASQAAATTLQTTGKGKHTDAGLGWFLAGGGDKERVAWHSGGWPGYVTFVLRFLDRPLTVVVLSNTEYLNVERIAKRMAEAELGR